MSQSRIDMFRDCWVICIVRRGISLCATFWCETCRSNRTTYLSFRHRMWPHYDPCKKKAFPLGWWKSYWRQKWRICF